MIQFQPVVATLKNGIQVTIREALPEDAEKLLHCIKTYIAQSEYIPKLESEITLTLSQEEDWIRSFQEHEQSLLLVAEYEGQILGNIDLSASRRKIMEHTGVIGMGMRKEWQNLGLGTALMQNMMDWAMGHPVLELIWLQVFSDNQGGLALYRKMGFVETGRIPQFFKRENLYSENVTMYRSVGPGASREGFPG